MNLWFSRSFKFDPTFRNVLSSVSMKICRRNNKTRSNFVYRSVNNSNQLIFVYAAFSHPFHLKPKIEIIRMVMRQCWLKGALEFQLCCAIWRKLHFSKMLRHWLKSFTIRTTFRKQVMLFWTMLIGFDFWEMSPEGFEPHHNHDECIFVVGSINTFIIFTLAVNIEMENNSYFLWRNLIPPHGRFSGSQRYLVAKWLQFEDWGNEKLRKQRRKENFIGYDFENSN